MIREITLKRLIFVCRGLAQSGSAPALGAGCRGFKSLIPDQLKVSISCARSSAG